MVKENKKYTGIIPFYFMKSVFFDNKICPVQYNMYGYPILKKPEEIKMVVDYFYSTEKNFKYISFRNMENLNYKEYLKDYFCKEIFDLYTTEVEIKKDYISVKKNYQKRFREKIEQLKRNHFIKIKNVSLDDINEIYKISVKFFKKRFGITSYPKWYFILFYNMIVKKGFGDFILLKFNEKIIGSAMFIKYKNKIIYLWGSYDINYIKLTPTSLLIDYIIEKYSGKTYTILDLGHSAPSNKGLLHYKAKFGGLHKKLFHIYISKNKKNLDNISRSDNLSIISEVIKIMPTSFIQLLTPIIFKLYRK